MSVRTTFASSDRQGATTMKKVIVVSGISGSGKSTYAHTLTANGGVILSADDYFTGYDTRPYSFDSTLLGKAHAMCFKLYVEQLQHALSEDRLVIVDNTNTTAVEIAPYMLAADAFGYLAEVHTLRCGSWNEVDMCLQRNRHEVPMRTVYAQQRRLDARELPPYWTSIVVPVTPLVR